MRAVIVSTSASAIYTGNGDAIPLDIHRGAFNVGIHIIPVSGTPTINIEHTPYSPLSIAGVTGPAMVWFPIAGALTSASTTVGAALTTPTQGLRVRQTGAGDARIVIIQAGLVNN